MTKHALIISTAALLTFSACGKSIKEKPDIIDNLGATTSITATYEFQTNSIVTDMAFSPNDIASWLGAVAIIGEDGTLHFSDIEAINTKAVTGRYDRVIGFNRPKAPAMFAVVNPSGTWRGYIESSDTFDFSPAPVVGAPGQNIVICSPYGSAVKTLSGINDKTLISYSSAISADGVLTLSAGAPRAAKVSNVKFCIVTPDGSILVAGDAGLSRLAPDGRSVRKTKSQYSSLAVLNAGTIIGVLDGDVVQIDPETLAVTRQLTIDSGLSISGVDIVGAIFVATAPYGGTAFNEGAVFLTDANAPRVVVISRRYFLNQLKPDMLVTP